jgi:hypothetical protein
MTLFDQYLFFMRMILSLIAALSGLVVLLVG